MLSAKVPVNAQRAATWRRACPTWVDHTHITTSGSFQICGLEDNPLGIAKYFEGGTKPPFANQSPERSRADGKRLEIMRPMLGAPLFFPCNRLHAIAGIASESECQARGGEASKHALRESHWLS